MSSFDPYSRERFFQDALAAAPTAPILGGQSQNTPYLTIQKNVAAPALAQSQRSVAPFANQITPMLRQPTAPDGQIGMNEGLMRIGGAIVGGSQKGGLNAFEAGTDMYGAIEDYNRSQALERYKQEMMLQKQRLANQKNAKKDEKDKPKTVSPYNQAVFDTLDTVIPQVEADINSHLNKWIGMGGSRTGLLGQIFSNIGGTGARDLEANIETIISNIGFDRLQKMREDSPTGGALGSVSERELSQLNSAIANLQTDQSPEQLLENLKRVRLHYEKALNALAADYAADGMPFDPMGGGYDFSAANALVDG